MRQNVLLNQLLITHDPRLLKTCISRNVLTAPQGWLTVDKLGKQIHGEYDFHSLHCVYKVCSRWCSAKTIYVGTTWSCYNGVRDKDHGIFAFTQYFFKNFGCASYTCYYGFLPIYTFLIMFYAISKLNFAVRLIHSRKRG